MDLTRTIVTEHTKKVDKATLNGWEITFEREYNEGQLPNRIEVSGKKIGDHSMYFSANHSLIDNSFGISYGGTAPDNEVTNAVFQELKKIVLEHQPLEPEA